MMFFSTVNQSVFITDSTVYLIDIAPPLSQMIDKHIKQPQFSQSSPPHSSSNEQNVVIEKLRRSSQTTEKKL